MRKAQFEIMGLAVVMIILTLGIFFILALSLNGGSGDSVAKFTEEQFSQNTIDVLLKSSVPGCAQYTAADIIYWKFTGRNGPSITQPNTICERVKIAGQISSSVDVDPALGEAIHLPVQTAIDSFLGKEYQLMIRKDCGESISEKLPSCVEHVWHSVGCAPNANADFSRAGRQQISLYPVSTKVDVILAICSPNLT